MYCPKCGKSISDDADFCQYCGKSLKESVQPSSTYAAASADNKRPIIFAIVGVLVIAGIIFAYNNILFGDDKIAYDIVVNASSQFKDPSSVRLVSGTLSLDKDYLFCGISAKNGFGARSTSYYSITPNGYIIENENPESIYKTRDELNIDKINKALDRHFGSD